MPTRCLSPLSGDQRALLASTLMQETEELTPELLESALRSLKRRHQHRELEQLQRRVKEVRGQRGFGFAGPVGPGATPAEAGDEGRRGCLRLLNATAE